MKKYKVQLTPRARASITRIISQLEAKVSKTVAQHVRRGIMGAIRRLNTFPESHEVFEQISTEKVVYHRTLQWEYKIVFTVQNDNLKVVVVQVYHGSRGDDWVKNQFS